MTKGTMFYRLRTAIDMVSVAITLLAYGCPVQAIVVAFGFDERTVAEWQRKAGEHCEQVHKHLVQGQPRDLGQVQADEIRVKVQGKVVWMAMAMMVSTRLWLGGVISQCRDFDLIAALAYKVRACALCLVPPTAVVCGWIGIVCESLQASISFAPAQEQSGTTTTPPMAGYPHRPSDQAV